MLISLMSGLCLLFLAISVSQAQRGDYLSVCPLVYILSAPYPAGPATARQDIGFTNTHSGNIALLALEANVAQAGGIYTLFSPAGNITALALNDQVYFDDSFPWAVLAPGQAVQWTVAYSTAAGVNSSLTSMRNTACIAWSSPPTATPPPKNLGEQVLFLPLILK